MIPVKTHIEIALLRRSGQILTDTFKEVEKFIKRGISTEKLSDVAEKVILERGGKPAFKGYNGFPAAACTSIDNEVVHGIPRDRILVEGEIISLDIGVELDGYFTDAAKTYGIGKISDDKLRLIKITKQALFRGIEKCRAGCHLSDISYAIQSYIEAKKANVVRELVGHGIGRKLREDLKF